MTDKEIEEGERLIANFMMKSLSHRIVPIKYSQSWDLLIPACKKFVDLSKSDKHKKLCEVFQYGLFHMHIEATFKNLAFAIQIRNENQ